MANWCWPSPSEAALAVIARRLGARTLKLEPDEPSAWQPFKRDRQVAKPAVDARKSTPGKPARAKKGHL